MQKRLTRALISLGVTVGAVAAGIYLSAGLGPERLRAEVERVLEQSTGSPVSMGSLRLVLGFPIHLDARDLRLFAGALTIDAASARVDIFSLLRGRPRLSRLTLDGAHLRIQRALGAQGTAWSPRPFAGLAERASRAETEPLLAPLQGIEATVRFLLTKPLLADTVELRRSRVSYVHDFSDRGGRIETIWFAGVHGSLHHRQLRGDAQLFLATQLVALDGPRGSIEWEGTRERSGAMRISMATTELELATLVPYLSGGGAGNRLRGRLSGVADFVTTTPGQGQLRLDLVTRDFESVAKVDGMPRAVLVDEFSAQMQIGLDERHLDVSLARIAGPALAFDLEAIVERPVGSESNAGLALSLRDIDLEQARALIDWLPERIRERARPIAASLLAGRIAAVELRGGAPVQRWRDVVAGRTTELPRGLSLHADVEGISVSVGAVDRLADVSARVTWSEDGITVEAASGSLNGSPLPTLDLAFKGVARLFESEHARQVQSSGAASLTGLTPLWSYLTEDADEPIDQVPSVWIEFDHLHHPALIWPLSEVLTRFEPTEHGAHLILSRGRWADVPLHGTMDLRFRPDRHIAVRLEAGSAAEVQSAAASPIPLGEHTELSPPSAAHEAAWAWGRFEIGAGAWHQRATQGRFHAVEGQIRFEDLDSELAPEGRIWGSAMLDLSLEDAVPYELRVKLSEGDLDSLLAQAGFAPGVATGRLDLNVALSGTIRPGASALAEASGLLRMEARDGSIRRSVPPVLAIALASESLRGFSSRDRLRYRRCASTLSLERGYLSTDALEIDGPDVRLFASGGLDLAHPPHPIDAEVVLFLFRQLDRALDKIPLLNVLLLGDNKNLVAAYFGLVGPWEAPVASSKPLRTLGEGPGDVLIEGIPKIVKRGIEALGGWISAPRQGTPAGEENLVPPTQRGDS
ncbi:MAG: hypothetical protein OEM49_02925 [Myxococcales bacterium]|nr:hypothetical protein [Myxococcales bacterium]